MNRPSDMMPLPLQHHSRKSVSLNLSERAFLLGLFLRLVVSNGLLDRFMSYTSPGGSMLEKLHPGTLLILFSIVLPRPRYISASEFGSFRRASYALLLVLGYSTFALVLQFGISSVAYLIDTFFCAIISGLYLISAGQAVAQKALRMIVVLVGVNAVIAIAEIALQSHLLPDPGFFFTYFRAYSIFGHPLLNALITGTIALFVLQNRSEGWRSVPYFLLAGTAILAFGARAALLMLVPIAMIAELGRFGGRFLRGRATLLEFVQIPGGIFLSAILGAALLFGTRFGERFLGMSDGTDNSLLARLNITSIFDSMTMNEKLFGMAPATKQMLLEQNPYFSTIENFWIDMSLSFGLVAFVPFALAFLLFLRAAYRSQALAGFASFLFFLAVASTNNSLSVKSPALLVFVVFLISARRQAATLIPERGTAPGYEARAA